MQNYKKASYVGSFCRQYLKNSPDTGVMALQNTVRLSHNTSASHPFKHAFPATARSRRGLWTWAKWLFRHLMPMEAVRWLL